jgi:hypothetical protein
VHRPIELAMIGAQLCRTCPDFPILHKTPWFADVVNSPDTQNRNVSLAELTRLVNVGEAHPYSVAASVSEDRHKATELAV